MVATLQHFSVATATKGKLSERLEWESGTTQCTVIIVTKDHLDVTLCYTVLYLLYSDLSVCYTGRLGWKPRNNTVQSVIIVTKGVNSSTSDSGIVVNIVNNTDKPVITPATKPVIQVWVLSLLLVHEHKEMLIKCSYVFQSVSKPV